MADGAAAMSSALSSGAALTHPYDRRTTTNWVETPVRSKPGPIPTSSGFMPWWSTTSTHSAPDVLLFSLLHPRWEFVFQPKYAAYLNLIEPW